MIMAMAKVMPTWDTDGDNCNTEAVLLQKSTPDRIELSIYSIELALAVLLHLELVELY